MNLQRVEITGADQVPATGLMRAARDRFSKGHWNERDIRILMGKGKIYQGMQDAH